MPVVREFYVAGVDHFPHRGTSHVCGNGLYFAQVLYKLVGSIGRTSVFQSLSYEAFRQLVFLLAQHPSSFVSRRSLQNNYTLNTLYDASLFPRTRHEPSIAVSRVAAQP